MRVKVVWLLSVLIAVLLVGQGGAKLVGSEFMVESFQHFGYGDNPLPRYAVGAVEVVGGFLVLVPRARFWALVGVLAMLVVLQVDVARRTGFPLPPEVVAILPGAAAGMALMAVLGWLSRPTAQSP
ncbi:MauE/DoxX family redox-associated membrane protein [Dactylosporangium sp. NPDC005572]|uniref:MauE/DoxX family redox-associated membrane protein n=1 Tax=Dactylosporangium sp. NPDC005572 TaxID=3156889 RepID=UPI00339F326B